MYYILKILKIEWFEKSITFLLYYYVPQGMYTILLSFLILSVSASNFCFDGHFANLTNLTSCTIVGKQYLPCDIFGIGAGYKVLYMSCDGSLNYNLPIGIDGGDTVQTQMFLNNATSVLAELFNETITIDCTTVPHTGYDWVCKSGIRNYNVLTCAMSAPVGETLPEFPESYICSGNGLKVGLTTFMGLILFLIIGY